MSKQGKIALGVVVLGGGVSVLLYAFVKNQQVQEQYQDKLLASEAQKQAAQAGALGPIAAAAGTLLKVFGL